MPTGQPARATPYHFQCSPRPLQPSPCEILPTELILGIVARKTRRETRSRPESPPRSLGALRRPPGVQYRCNQPRCSRRQHRTWPNQPKSSAWRLRTRSWDTAPLPSSYEPRQALRRTRYRRRQRPFQSKPRVLSLCQRSPWLHQAARTGSLCPRVAIMALPATPRRMAKSSARLQI